MHEKRHVLIFYSRKPKAFGITVNRKGNDKV